MEMFIWFEIGIVDGSVAGGCREVEFVVWVYAPGRVVGWWGKGRGWMVGLGLGHLGGMGWGARWTKGCKGTGLFAGMIGWKV